jgi:DNA repair protein SbcC/Rad50
MRPIAMDMRGFASFREPTRVDFTDADFFALVGPTGAGKSTVIDAMTFALYGSVPRWGRKGMVSLALAPSVARATVKLVFEVEGQRYVVARELRRMSGQVSQRAASLERILDPNGLAQPGEATAPLAKDLNDVNDAVVRLLGLSYEDFTQCVVLPQGRFADFLHARPGERQEILLRLLGAEHYKQMMMKANQRASTAAQRADTISETLLSYADATEESEERSRAAQTSLTALADRVKQALPCIGESQTELSAAEDRLRRRRDEHAALSTVRVPDDVAALDANLMASRADLARLRTAEQEAENGDTAARAALTAGPQRAPLELARQRRGERNTLQDGIPSLQAEAARLAAQAEAAAAAAETAAAALENLRGRRDDAARDAKVAGELVTRLEGEHAALATLSVPRGVTALDERQRTAAAAAAAAGQALAVAEEADSAAREARDGAAPEAPLAQASRDLSELRDLVAALSTAQHAVEQARAARTAAETELANETETLRKQREALEEAQRVHVIAGLRPHLVAGEACPLCEQTVMTLPAATPSTDVDEARASLQVAERAVVAAQTAVTSAATAAERAEAGLESKTAHWTRLTRSLSSGLSGPLGGAPLPAVRAVTATGALDGTADAADLIESVTAEVTALMHTRVALDKAATAAAKEAEKQRARQRAAQTAARQADDEVSAARVALRAARDPLVQLGAPQVDAADLADGWTTLAAWAEDQKQARAADLAAARAAADAVATRHRTAAAEFGQAQQVLTGLQADATTAVEGDQRARAKLNQATERIAELDNLLRDALGEDQIAEQLALLDELEQAAAGAGKKLLTARAVRADGEAALASLERAERLARAALSTARDSVVALGAPALEGLGLLDAWTQLAAWAASQTASREQQIRVVSAEVGAAQASVARLTGEVSADLAKAGIDLPADAVAAGAASAVATALERAKAATNRIKERRAEAAELHERQQAAREEQQVAKLLGDLLRADNFQRWLVNAAVDDLVTEASATLSSLSSAQFDLVYDDGDFYVIDHTDADARRSVRTLSGGETFQASLALALALSSQISALAAAGAARLDSIFLDEGFGTLDPETLEVVATTLETLAQGERMVGVVTHVVALAERVPVRFRVTRNSRTSTISREGLAAMAEEEDMA